jgi:hypothetical protein
MKVDFDIVKGHVLNPGRPDCSIPDPFIASTVPRNLWEANYFERPLKWRGYRLVGDIDLILRSSQDLGCGATTAYVFSYLKKQE